MKQKLSWIFHSEATSGILLVMMTILSLIVVNTSLQGFHTSLLHLNLGIRVGEYAFDKSIHHWINDGLMAIFFLHVGLEVKRESIDGSLSSIRAIALPAFAAIGGMAVPALIYLYFNIHDPVFVRGWAIPTATDIAFALGILSLLGSRVPLSLKIFLMALAIIDDLGAIVVIALFYTVDLSVASLVVAGISLGVLIIFNRLNIRHISLYFAVGMVLWVSVLESGVHATLAGVALAFTIPYRFASHKTTERRSPLIALEHSLHPWVIYFILPLFAFVNAGVDLRSISIDSMLHSVPLGIFFGLLIGKQLGVFGFSWIAIRLGLSEMPQGATWGMLYGVSLLTGIGFTMSLFIDSLAFVDDTLFDHMDRVAILSATVLSATVGYLVLRRTLNEQA